MKPPIEKTIVAHCVVCGEEISFDRIARGAITCTQEHARERRRQLTALQERKKCKYCHRPSTPAEREAFKQFRKVEKTRPDLLYPNKFEEYKQSGGAPTPEAFAGYLESHA